LAAFGAIVFSPAWMACVRDPAEKAGEHRQRADAYRGAGQHREASIEYQAALQEHPQDVQALYGLAKSLEALGQPAAYRDTLRQLLRVSPEHPQTCVELGGLLWAAGNYTESLDLARRVPATAAIATDARRLEAKALASLGQREKSRKVWDLLLGASPGDEAVHLEAAHFEAWVGDTERAEQILRAGLETAPQWVSLWLALAQLEASTADVEGSEAALARAEEADPDAPRVLATRARLLIRRGKLQAGLDFLEEAQARLPEEGAKIALERTRILLELGELSEARRVLQQAQEEHPKHPGLAAVVADVLISEGQTEEARELLPLAWQYDPSGRIPRLLEARIYMADGRTHWALLVLEGLAAKGDLSVETRFLYARALAGEARWAAARREYAAVLRRLPDHVMARLDFARLLRVQQDYEGSLAQLEILPKRVREAPRVRLQRAEILLDKGNAAEARRILRGVLKEAPTNPVVLKLLGDAERVRGRHKEAIRNYRKSREQDPKALEPLFAEAFVLKEQGADPKAAVKLLNEHQSREGEHPQVLNQIARIHLEDGSFMGAKRAVERSLLLEPNFWETRLLKAGILLAEGDGPKAAVEFEEAINLNPFHPDAYNQLARIYRTRGDLSSAQATYQRLLDRNPGEPQTANNLANLLLEQGKVAPALRLAREAYAGTPKNLAVLDTLGWALEQAGQPVDAEPFLREAVAGYPDHPEVLFHWAVNLASRGASSEAEITLRRVVTLAGDSPVGARARELLRGNP
jgi:tetratricopeptide (TPR) repeat protein